VSPHFIQCLPSIPHGPGVPHDITFPAVSPPVDEISLAQYGGRKGIGGPLLQLMGLKAMWAGPFGAGWAVLHSGQALLHSAFF
jgi:hypothetical protein